MENTKPNGIHNLLELKGCDPQQINNLKKIKEILVGSANISDIKILSKKFKKFKPHGLTGFLLLSASHISIHTWPEFNYCTIDIFTCSGEKNAKKIKDFIISKIQHEELTERNIFRGYNHNKKILPIFSSDRDMEVEILENFYTKKNKYQKIEILETKEFGKCLIIDDVIQLSERDNFLYDEAMTSRVTEEDKNILILGGGDMFVSKYLIKKHPQIEKIKIVDIDRDVYNGCLKYFHNNKIDEKVEMEFYDVIKFLKKNKSDLNNIDHIIFDLTDNPVSEEIENTKLFYEKIFDLIPENTKVSIQAGVPNAINRTNAYEIIKDFLDKKYKNKIIEKENILIPSYGEEISFIFKK